MSDSPEQRHVLTTCEWNKPRVTTKAILPFFFGCCCLFYFCLKFTGFAFLKPKLAVPTTENWTFSEKDGSIIVILPSCIQ